MPEPDPAALDKPALLNRLAAVARSEEMFRTLAENAPCMLWMTDTTGAPSYFNRQWLAFCGVDQRDALDAWTRSLHPDDAGPIGETFLQAVSSLSEYKVEYRLRRYDGHYRNMLAHGMPRYDRDGEALGYVGVTFDISDLKNAEKALRETHRELESRSQQIALLNELNDNLQVCKNIEETRPILQRFGLRMFPEGAVSICLFKSSRNIVEPFVSWGGDTVIDHVFAPDDCWALRRGKTHIEVRGDEGLVCPNRGSSGCTNYVCVPMMAYGEVLGTLNIDFSKEFSALTSEQCAERQSAIRELASMTADQVALALANLQLRATLQYQSTRDSLTQLFNRRYLSESLERELARAERQGSEVALLMLDIDHFKRFNDTHGHAAGDAVLREFGALLLRLVRPSDIACRYGGEEFAVMMPEAPRTVVRERAEQIRRQTSNIAIEHLGQPVTGVTVSIGVSFYPAAGTNFEAVLADADATLYRAKAEGRDRVAISETEVVDSATVRTDDLIEPAA